jgi:low temperature requirement protein LtrA
MSGRDPDEQHRAVTPLELLYDLTFVVAFGQASGQFAHLLAEGHYSAGLIGFGFATFGICWAWINFSWFARHNGHADLLRERVDGRTGQSFVRREHGKVFASG